MWSSDLRPNDQLTGSYCGPEVRFWEVGWQLVKFLPSDEQFGKPTGVIEMLQQFGILPVRTKSH